VWARSGSEVAVARRTVRSGEELNEQAPPEGFPQDLEQDVTLLDGREVFVRPILPSDADELRRAVENADPETLRTRFLGGSPPHHEEDFQHLVRVDYDRRMAVVAFAKEGQGVGIARYEAVEDGDAAEVSVAIDPAWRQVGLASALVRVLGEAAVQHGIHRFSAEFFADNVDVADILTEAGLPYQSRRDDAGVVSVDIELPGSDAPTTP
ncbi:MAG: GNAT family N-acetyltransferase, partial [Mycobacteriales bacterium]